MRRPYFRSQTTALLLGLVLLGAGAWCLHDAYERRGGDQPWWLRPFSWW